MHGQPHIRCINVSISHIFVPLHYLNCAVERGKIYCDKTTIFIEIIGQVLCFYNFKFIKLLGNERIVVIER